MIPFICFMDAVDFVIISCDFEYGVPRLASEIASPKLATAPRSPYLTSKNSCSEHVKNRILEWRIAVPRSDNEVVLSEF